MPGEYHVVCANLIQRDGDTLLVQEGKEHVKGRWNLPAGGLEPGETPENCAEREAKEETGLNVFPESLVGVYLDHSDRMGTTVLVFVFHATILSGDPRVPENEEILDVGFFSPTELNRLELRAPYIEPAIEAFEDGASHPLSVIADVR